MQAPNTVDCHSVTHLLPNILRQALRQFSASSHSCRRHAFTARHATCPATAYHAFPFFLAPRHRAYLSRPHSIRLPPHPCTADRRRIQTPVASDDSLYRHVQQPRSKDCGPRQPRRWEDFPCPPICEERFYTSYNTVDRRRILLDQEGRGHRHVHRGPVTNMGHSRSRALPVHLQAILQRYANNFLTSNTSSQPAVLISGIYFPMAEMTSFHSSP